MSDLVAHQKKLEALFNKNQLVPRIRAEFINCAGFDFVKYMEEKQINVEFGLDLLIKMALHKRCNLPTLVGLLRHHAESAQDVADQILSCAVADLVDWEPNTQTFIVRYTVSDDVQQELDRFQFPLPMVVEPKTLTHNKQTGYLAGSGSVIMRNNHTDDDVCLDHLNRMNKVKLTLNMKVAQAVANKWRNLDRAKDGETKEDFERRKRAFEKYDRTARDVMNTLCQHSDTFYLTHRYDKRGRTYCSGYHVTYQGAPWNKAVIEFANKEIVT